MAFDDEYFTSVDTSSYFTVNGKSSIYNAAQGITLGESFTPALTPLAGTNLAINHGLPSVMISAWEPKAGVREGHGAAVDRISQLQEQAIGELLSVNKMNLTMHAPIVDIMGIISNERGAQVSSQQRQDTMNLLKFNMKQADRISEKAGLEKIPFNIHASNFGAVGHRFDSGFRNNKNETILGTHDYLVDKDSGRIIPNDSDFQFMDIKKGKESDYDIIPDTVQPGGVMALFEITPDKRMGMANRTALDEEWKKVADAQIKIKQLKDQGVDPKSEIMKNLNTTIHTAMTKIEHLESPYFKSEEKKQQIIHMKDFSEAVVPKQLAELAMASLKDTKTHPVIAVENEPGWQLGSNPELLISWVNKGREEFADKLVNNEGYSRKDAEMKANELIGVTLDTGHLNTLKSQINPKTNKKWTDNELEEQARRMAATGAKLVHIADNIGELGQDTHMIIGRGNAKNEEYLKILKEHGFKGQAQFEAFTGECEFDKLSAQANLMGLGAPIYSMQAVPRFTEVGMDLQGPYSLRNVNYGHQIPSLHFSQWGGSFAGLPSTFGAGQGERKDQFSGTPTE
ncbi:hypothetical protein COX58_01175 [archaeon CG_4_10_14_0_2_um_filter_Archaea_38_6]|nr:MAG: hypothetical protein COX58_01175 [archaeon CG_4_10_14_0_2_um_filter_Archaea_38_6]